MGLVQSMIRHFSGSARRVKNTESLISKYLLIDGRNFDLNDALLNEEGAKIFAHFDAEMNKVKIGKASPGINQHYHVFIYLLSYDKLHKSYYRLWCGQSELNREHCCSRSSDSFSYSFSTFRIHSFIANILPFRVPKLLLAQLIRRI